MRNIRNRVTAANHVRGCITDFVFKVKRGQTETQDWRIITLLSLSITRLKRIWMEVCSHQAFCNTENHCEIKEGWQSWLGVTLYVLESICQMPFLPSLPHPSMKANTWLQRVHYQGKVLDFGHHRRACFTLIFQSFHRLTSLLSK